MYRSSFTGILRNLPQNYTPNITCESASTEIPYVFNYTADYTDNNCWDIELIVKQDGTNDIDSSSGVSASAWGPFTFTVTATGYAPAILTSSTYEGAFDIKMEQYVTRILNEKTNTGYVIKDTEARNSITTLDSNVVKTSGNQTISGEKTFTTNIVNQKTNPQISLKNTEITKGTAPSSTKYSVLGAVYDSQGDGQANKMAQVYNSYFSNGGASLSMNVFKPESGSTTSSSIIIGYDGNGNVYTEAPTPATSDNSNKIATTGFVKAQGYATTNYVTDTAVTKSNTYYDSATSTLYIG